MSLNPNFAALCKPEHTLSDQYISHSGSTGFITTKSDCILNCYILAFIKEQYPDQLSFRSRSNCHSNLLRLNYI